MLTISEETETVSDAVESPSEPLETELLTGEMAGEVSPQKRVPAWMEWGIILVLFAAILFFLYVNRESVQEFILIPVPVLPFGII